MKPTLFLIGMILSALGITLGIFYDTHYFILLFIGLILILIKGNTNTNDFCVKFAEYYLHELIINKSKLTYRDMLFMFKKEDINKIMSL